MAVIKAFVNGQLWEWPVESHLKRSLARKAARHIAQTSFEGSVEADGLAYSCGYYKMKNGFQVPLAKEFSATIEGEKIKFSEFDGVIYFDFKGTRYEIKVKKIPETAEERLNFLGIAERTIKI